MSVPRAGPGVTGKPPEHVAGERAAPGVGWSARPLALRDAEKRPSAACADDGGGGRGGSNAGAQSVGLSGDAGGRRRIGAAAVGNRCAAVLELPLIASLRARSDPTSPLRLPAAPRLTPDKRIPRQGRGRSHGVDRSARYVLSRTATLFIASRDTSTPRRTAISWATMLMAISAGVTAPMSRPIGACTRSRHSAGMPSSARRL